MEVHIVLYLFAFIINISLYETRETINVKLKQGEVSGRVQKTFLKHQNYYAFKGIPFAQPPTGDLRFKPPVQHIGWKNVYQAHKSKPTCIQYNSRMRMGEQFGMSGSEDCLYISVFTPNLNASAPVIVFEYNDNFKTSFNGTEAYSPDFFMEEDTVVVTISHRLMVLGYLTTEDNIIPPNAGLKDYIMGLNWVKDNIQQFGGDPNRVTLMGSRGGAILAEILLYSKKAENLFNSVIIQSGTALENDFFSENSRSKAFELGEKLNITADNSQMLLEALQKMDIQTIYNKVSDVITQDGDDFFTFSPIVENNYPEAVITSIPEKSKIITDIPVMIGMNSREGLDLITQYLFQPQLMGEVGQDFLFLFPIRTNYKFDMKSNVYKNATKEIINFYFKEGHVYYGNILEYSVYIGDILQNYALNLAAKKLSEKMKSPVFYYMFDFRGQLNENSDYIARHTPYPLKPWGATITDELCYLHFCTRIEENYQNLLKLVSEQPEIKVLKKMVRLWTNFAKSRNPTPSKQDDILKDFIWKPINKDSNDTDYLHITKLLKMKTNPLGKREEFWDGFLNKYADLAVDGIIQDIETEKKHDEL